MAKRIIFIHGRAQKPSKKSLENLWYQAAQHGLERDFGKVAAKKFENMTKDFAYYGNLSNNFLKVPTENPTSRFKALEELKEYEKNAFTKANYKKISKFGGLKESLADLFSGAAGKIGIAEPLISKVAPDMAHYWYEDSYFGSDTR